MISICTQIFTIIIRVDAHKYDEFFKKLVDKKSTPIK